MVYVVKYSYITLDKYLDKEVEREGMMEFPLEEEAEDYKAFLEKEHVDVECKITKVD